MSDFHPDNPIHWALKAASHLREPWQRVWLREAIPFLATAQWGAGALDLKQGEPSLEELDALVDSVTASLDPIGLLRPERVVAFILADWEEFTAAQVERPLLRLSDRFPESKVEALPLHEEASLNFELVIAVGG